jgi:hypothetical protein
MSADLRTINLQNLPDVIRLMNESSRGMSFEWNLDLLSFMAFLRYWDFSYEHSLIGYVENEPAALIINCANPESHEAYTVYWGALPKFRTQRISLILFNACCKKLRDDGYFMLHGVSVPDRPVRRYRFIQAQPELSLVDMEAELPNLPAPDPNLEVREINVDALSQFPLTAGEPFHWSQRLAFLRNVAPFQQFLGAFSGNMLRAYAVALPHSSNTTITDLRSAGSDPSPGYELLRWLLHGNYRPPFTANYVFEQSYAHRLLTSAGFSVKRQFSTLTRDLRATA